VIAEGAEPIATNGSSAIDPSSVRPRLAESAAASLEESGQRRKEALAAKKASGVRLGARQLSRSRSCGVSSGKAHAATRFGRSLMR